MPGRGGRGGGGRGGGGRGGGGRGGGGRRGGGSRSGGGGSISKSSSGGRNGPSNKQATTTTTTTTRWPYFWPFANVKFILSPTKKVFMTPAPFRETTPPAFPPTPRFPPTPGFPPTPDFQPTPDEIWINKLFLNMKNITTETPVMTSMTSTNTYGGNGISSIGNSFKNESTDISSLQKESQYFSINNTAVIAAIGVIAALIIVCIFIAIYLWRRQKVAKSESKENSFSYQADLAYSTPDKHLQTISGLVGACYAKENDYCRLENNANKKIEKENSYKPKIVWSRSKQSETEADPPYADYSTVYSGKI